MSWLLFVLMGLAAFRLTRLIVYDQITEFLRKPFFMEIEKTSKTGEVEIYLMPKQNGLLGWMAALLSCYWCTGIWVAGFLYVMNRYYPTIAEPLILILAIAGIAAILETYIQKKISGE